MKVRGWRVHWAWVPAAGFAAAVGWTRYGWWTLLLIAIGLALGIFLELRGRRRRAADR